MAVAGSLGRVGHVRLRRSSQGKNNRWLLEIPEHAIQALAQSTVGTGVYGGALYGTSFQNNTSIAIHVLGGGTNTGGTGWALLIGTGLI